MASRIAAILEMLNDGKWHALEEIHKKIDLQKNHVQQIVDFLEDYEFITMDETRKKMRVPKVVRNFLTR